jgi:hypothetical protein
MASNNTTTAAFPSSGDPEIDAYRLQHAGHERQHSLMMLIILGFLLGFQVLSLWWQRKHQRSYQAVTLAGMWVRYLPGLYYILYCICVCCTANVHTRCTCIYTTKGIFTYVYTQNVFLIVCGIFWHLIHMRVVLSSFPRFVVKARMARIHAILDHMDLVHSG